MSDTILSLVFLLAPWVLLLLAIRHGPVASRWWRGENPVGFAITVAIVSFSIGFFGPMILFPGANQGPLIGFLYTGPAGLILGFAWGLVRWFGRRQTHGGKRPG